MHDKLYFRRWDWITGKIKEEIQVQYRHDPIPHTGRKGSWCYYRNIKTTQELRINKAHYHEYREFECYGFRIRGRRKNLPDSWWDINRHLEKCWKRQRKTQWK